MKRFLVTILLLLSFVAVPAAEASAKCRTQITWSNDPNHAARTIAAIRQYNWNHATAIRIAKRESQLGLAVRGYNTCTKDNSYGPMMVNFHGGQKARLASIGITPTLNIEEGVAIAYRLYQYCGNAFGPWVKYHGRYSCNH